MTWWAWILLYVLAALLWLRFWIHRAVVNAQEKGKSDPWKFDAWNEDDQAITVTGSIFWPVPTIYFFFKYLIKPIAMWLMFPTRRTRRDRRLRKELRAQEQQRKIAAQAATIGEQQAQILALHEELGIPFPGQSK